MIKKYLKLISILIIFIIIYNVIIEKSGKKSVTSYEITNKIDYVLSRKYDILLYGRIEELKNLYSSRYNNKIKDFANNKYYEEILNEYYDMYIDNVYKKIGNIYVVEYTVTSLDNSSKNLTMKVKMNFNNTRAVIIYDDMFEVE